ncbi:histone-like nucleoid-structuring protein Lsr2 [Microbacterium enclense]|uniref:histone-like nucleoid-structuring protein Lsr2 n=1 Tax=Microbacterium enclense TaxID=993073 RepID=UPI003F7F1A01
MAKKHFTQVIDDLDGSVIDDGATVQFSFDGRAYEIDLSKQNAEKMRDALRPYISAGRTAETHHATPRRTPRGRAIPTRDLADVRSWAQKNGHSINTRGRISAAVLEAYDAAH